MAAEGGGVALGVQSVRKKCMRMDSGGSMSERQVIVQVSAPWLMQINGLLAKAGWQSLGVGAFETLSSAERQDVHAGILQLDDGDQAELNRLDELMAGRAEIEWIALVSPESLSNARLRRFL